MLAEYTETTAPVTAVGYIMIKCDRKSYVVRTAGLDLNKLEIVPTVNCP